MSDFGETTVAAARLKMLELLSAASGYSANNQILQTGLDAMGIRMSSTSVRAELSYLQECRTVKLMAVGTLTVAELTERGLDVAKGVSTLRGIDRPVPGSGL